MNHEDTHDFSGVGKEASQQADSRIGLQGESQSGPAADDTEPSDVTKSRNDPTELESDIAESGSPLANQPAAGTAQTAESDLLEPATEATETNSRPGVESSLSDTQLGVSSGPSPVNPVHLSVNHPSKNHPQEDLGIGNTPVDGVSTDPSPVDVSTIDLPTVDPSPNDSHPENAYPPKSDTTAEETIAYDDTTENSYYEDFYDHTTEGTVPSDPYDNPTYEAIDQPSSYESSEPISEEVATELAPFLAASVAQGVDRIGYVDLSAPTNFQTGIRPTEPPRHNFTNVHVGTAYFGGLAPAPPRAPAPAPAQAPVSAPAPGWAQLGSSGPAPAPASSPAATPGADPTGQRDSWPQLQRPAPAIQNRQETLIYDNSPWNPIIPAFAQSVGQAGRPSSLFSDVGVRRGGTYPPTVTARPRPSASQQEQEYVPSGIPAREESTPAPEVTTSRGSFVQVAQDQSTSPGSSPTRPPYASIPVPESVSIRQTLRILPKEDNGGTDLQKQDGSATAHRRPPPAALSRPGIAARPRPDPANRPRPRPSRPPPRTTPSSTEYHTEVSTSEIREESHARPDNADQTRPNQLNLLEPEGGVDRLGIAFVTRPPTRRPLPAPTATTTQRVVVVNAAPAGGDIRPVQLALPPATSYQGVYQPIRSRPAPPLSPSQQPQSQSELNGDQPGDDDYVGSAGTVVVSPQPEAGAAPQPPEQPLLTGVSSVLAGALGGALSGAPDGPSAPGDASAPSREQLLNLFRLIALRYPALVANMDQEQLQLLLNDEAARRKLLAPFLGNDKSRTPGEPQRTNTKLLELANISINGTQVDRRGNGRALRREVAGGAPSNRHPPPQPRRPFVSRLSSSVLRALANFTRVKVAGGPPGLFKHTTTSTGSPRPRPVIAATPGSAQSAPSGSLSDRLHQLVGFPTRAPPRGGNGTTTGSSRGKLSHKLMRFHGERTNPDGGKYDRAPLFAALRGTRGAPPPSERPNLPRHTTRLPKSSPIHVIHYHEGESVEDILDKIFARFQQKPSQNELKTAAQKPWTVVGATQRPVATAGQNSLATRRPITIAAQPNFSYSDMVTTTTTPSKHTAISPPPTSNNSHEQVHSSSDPQKDVSKLPAATSKPAEGSSEPAEVAEEADNEIDTAYLQGGATGIRPPVRPNPAFLLRNQTVASECRLPLIPNLSVASNSSPHDFHLPT